MSKKKCLDCQAKDETISSLNAIIKSLNEMIMSLTAPKVPNGFPGFPVQPQPWWHPQQVPFFNVSDSSDPMAHCPCRVENGGSGVCMCVQGGPKITC
jgi:hypothetical protein